MFDYLFSWWWKPQEKIQEQLKKDIENFDVETLRKTERSPPKNIFLNEIQIKLAEKFKNV